MNKGKDAERRFSNLSAAAAVLICGVLQVRTLGDGQVVEHLARYNAKGSRAKVTALAGSRPGPVVVRLTRHAQPKGRLSQVLCTMVDCNTATVSGGNNEVTYPGFQIN